MEDFEAGQDDGYQRMDDQHCRAMHDKVNAASDDIPSCPPSLQIRFYKARNELESEDYPVNVDLAALGLDDDGPAPAKDNNVVECYTKFAVKSGTSAAKVLGRLIHFFKKYKGCRYSTNKTGYKVKADVQGPAGMVSAKVQVLTEALEAGEQEEAETSKPRLVVRVRKCKGDSNAFRALYADIWSGLCDLAAS